MNDPDSPRVRVLKAEHADIEDRLNRAIPLIEKPRTAREIHDRAADEAEGERMEDIEEELHRLG
jgi:capsule polysaccharide export protein KpsE/RkpR